MDTRDPHAEALAELHEVLGEALARKLKAKHSAKLDRSKPAADQPDTQMGAKGEAATESDPIEAKKKMHFGHTGK